MRTINCVCGRVITFDNPEVSSKGCECRRKYNNPEFTRNKRLAEIAEDVKDVCALAIIEDSKAYDTLLKIQQLVNLAISRTPMSE